MMRTGMAMTTSIVGGSRIGASAVQYLHAQAMPPAYVVTDADVANVDAYTREYLPLVRKAFVEGGEKYLASNGRVLAVAAEPPRRLAILVFETWKKAQTALTSSAFRDARAVGQKYASFRTYAVEGRIPQ